MKRVFIMVLFIICSLFILSALDNYDYGFYPQGWSADGYFAFIYYKSFFDGMGPGTDFHLRIQNLVTDEIVFVLDYTDDVEVEIAKSIPEVLALHEDEVAAAYKQFNIVVDQSTQILEFPVVVNGTTVEAAVLDTYIEDESFLWGPTLDYFRIELVRSSDGYIKRAFERFLSFNTIIQWDLRVAVSPFEPRLAMILYLGSPGWEGIPLETYFMVIGSHLNYGFQPSAED